MTDDDNDILANITENETYSATPRRQGGAIVGLAIGWGIIVISLIVIIIILCIR